MNASGIISAIIVGLIVGALGRLVVPGKQHIPIWLTIVIGVVAAFLGTWIGSSFVDEGDGFSIVVLLLQVLLAAGGVFLVAGAASRRTT